MNERIKELEKRATEEVMRNTPSFLVTNEMWKEKFAELIVKRMIDNVECHADLYDSPDIKFICEKIVNSIKFDFGVEE